MMPAYDALMKQGGVGQPTGMRATPAHHILEEKENPVTGEKKIVGSDWRNRAQAQADKLKGLAYDESVPMHHFTQEVWRKTCQAMSVMGRVSMYPRTLAKPQTRSRH